ncbi:uncharacterized protein PGTG_09759 [Puccinia graminis f. sp. tritici CRL 75-36-700-3]|uniref:Glyoxal oxidase N-terminal domain-containing protein n=1 Tax=Puccinia graminis f. sp. tritici (strain CRL 75-36-700-3 / race SCCL) TaxID=418459 RepID=E3KIC1_PUCGT|nr:uncharacterized protein PGTG_09759 [Puccinia graminis f. sp. tritici CRL 75-36-700-3]EFP84046.1 hypothetical protein PGTG_09759 [Puccinia graminis f. sp. tritici CRL 75-36-700-3]
MRVNNPQSRSWLNGLAIAAAFSPFGVSAGAAPNTFEVVGTTGVSAQQFFVGGINKVYILDKAENNPLRLPGTNKPAWATEYDLRTNTFRTMEVATNTFCAEGAALSNGTRISVGGNKAVTFGGLDGVNLAGTLVQRRWCQWSVNPGGALLQAKRWYPTVETLEDGSVIIIGGCTDGGYVNDANQNIPTVEYFPSKGQPNKLNFLLTTLPANLYTLTWLLPSGNLFLQSNLGTEIYDYKNNVEYPLPNMPHAVRTYPASGATAMLPLTPKNNYTATILFCGGTNLQPDQWVLSFNIAAYPADNSCVKMTPDVSTEWEEEDYLFEGRSMGQFVMMPDGRLWMGNGIAKGTAGYGNTSWAIGQSFGSSPLHAPAYYNPNAPKGSRWSRPMGNATVSRLYHSVASLLADGSILTAGSNPNADYIAPGTPNYPFPTEYRAEKFYPDYFNRARPSPSALPKTLSYGGNYFNVSLKSSDLGKQSSALPKTFVSIVRTGYSTHAMNMGQRFLQLNSTYTHNDDGSGMLHVSQMPPCVACFPPGPAMMFVVVDGVPSNGVMVMIGSGQIGAQPVGVAADLPGTVTDWTTSQSMPSPSKNAKHSSSSHLLPSLPVVFLMACALIQLM